MDYLKKDNVLLAYKEDIRKKGVIDWLRAHTSFLKPMHRYDGEIILMEKELVLDCEDKDEGKDFTESIKKDELTDVHLGFDETFRKSDDRSGGLTFRPLRIKYTKNGKEETVYIITGFSRLKRTTNNESWYEAILKWME